MQYLCNLHVCVWKTTGKGNMLYMLPKNYWILYILFYLLILIFTHLWFQCTKQLLKSVCYRPFQDHTIYDKSPFTTSAIKITPASPNLQYFTLIRKIIEIKYVCFPVINVRKKIWNNKKLSEKKTYIDNTYKCMRYICIIGRKEVPWWLRG